MIETKLVILEGIMGSGKSMTSKFLIDHLKRNGIPAARYGNPKNGMRLPPDELRRLLRQLPDRRLVWERLAPDELMSGSLQAWTQFVAGAQYQDEICVFDGRWFNGDFAGLMMMDVPEVRLKQHLFRVAELASRLNPCIIYLYSSDVRTALQCITKLRGREWEEAQIGWKLESPYCRCRGLKGIDGWLSLYGVYQGLCRRFLAQLGLPVLQLEVSEGDWFRYHTSILEFLDVPACVDPNYPWLRLTDAARTWLSQLLGKLVSDR